MKNSRRTEPAAKAGVIPNDYGTAKAVPYKDLVVVTQALKPLTADRLCRVANYEVPSRNQSLPSVIQLVQIDLAAQCVAMNSKQASCARLVAVKTVQHALDEFLFKFVNRLIEMDSMIHHHSNQRLQLLLHRSTLRTRVVFAAGRFRRRG